MEQDIMVSGDPLAVKVVTLRRPEDTLLKAGALQNAIFNSANFSCIATDAKGVIQLFNIGAERMLGYLAAEVINKITPADLHDPQEVIARAKALSLELGATIAPGFEVLVYKASRGIEDIYEVTKVRKDGSRFPAVLSVTALRDTQNAIIGYLLIATDNTARKRAEVDRKRFFALSQDVFCILGFDGYFKDLNQAWEKTLGYTKAELLATPFIEFIHPEDRERTLAEADKVSGGKVLIAFENRYRCKDGTYRSFQWSVTPIIEDRVMYGVAHDITESKRTEEARLVGEARYRTLFEYAPDGIVIADPESCYIDANASICKMLGYTREEMIGLHASNIVAESEVQHIGPALNAIKTESNYHREWQFRRKDSSVFAAEVIATKMPDGNLLAMIHDITLRKRHEARLHRLVDSNAQGVMFWNTRGEITGANDAFLKIVGYTREDLEARRIDWAKMTPAGYADLDRRSLEELAATGTCTPFEKEYIRKDGSCVPVMLGAATFKDNPDEGVCFVLDITARKQAEATLLKAGALQTAIFNSANFSSIATDAKGVIQIFNVGAERMLGYAAGDVLNKITPADISDPQEVIARAKALSAELATTITPGFEALVFKASRGIEDIYELTYIRKDGSRFPAVVSVTALRDEQNGIIGYLLIGTDNTARKLAEEALLKAGALQNAIFKSANFSCIATDAKGVIQLFNVGAERMMGYTATEVLNKITPAQLHDPQEMIVRAEALSRELGTTIAPGFEALVFKASRGIEDVYELTKIRKDGSRFPAVVSVTALRDAQDGIIGYLLIGTDNTARQQVEEERKRFALALQETNVQLESAKAVAEKANLAKSDFLSSMSHELRSPLSAILGFAQLMESASPPPTLNQTKSINRILQAGWYLLKLINEVLDLAVIESGKVSLSTEPVSLSELMNECQSMMEPQAQTHGIRMTFPLFENPVFVSADRTRLKQIIINLISNAIKYNKEQGTVTVDYSVDCLVGGPKRIRIGVRDTGAGLPPEKLTQLFSPFNRLGQEAGSVAGTGIGLVVSKRLVEQMGGVIGVESSVGTGSVFWFELLSAEAPRIAAESGEAKPVDQPEAWDAAPRRTLLYVEDNPANTELVEELIGRFPDLALATAINGTLGIEVARATHPKVILMDINLPGINGIKALKILREDPGTAHIPVIALSANAMPRDIEKGLEAGFFRYLTKPIQIKEFMATLHEALEFAEKRLVQTPATGATA